MSVQVGINGFGRIGRLLVRLGLEDPALHICAINDPGMTPDYMAYLLKYDTVHGRFPGEVSNDGSHLIVNGRAIRVFSAREPRDIPWASVRAQYVLEASGLFTKRTDAAGHLAAGAKKVLITAPSPDAPMFVMGVNQDRYTPEMDIVSNASCTTNALAPIAKVLQDSFGIRSGLMTTVHSTTATQRTVDGPSKKDWRGGRAASANIIPSATGAAKAVGSVIPELRGRLTGMAFRVPTLDSSVLDLTVNLRRNVSYETVCAALRQASEGPLHGILGCTGAPLVSSDFIGDRHASVFDADAGMGPEDGFVKLVAWYDNETGYSAMVLRLLRHMARCDGCLQQQ